MTAFAAVYKMAATQAESQLNETNREHLLDKSSEISNNTLQNGTEKNGARSVNVGAETSGKTKYSAHNYNVDMSQYRSDTNIGPPMQHEQNDELNAKHNPEKPYLQNIDNGGNEIGYNKGLPETATGPNVPNYNLPFSPRNNFTHPEHGTNPVQMNSVDGSVGNNCNNSSNANNIHQNSTGNQYGNVRHPFPNSKPALGSLRPVGSHLNTHTGNFSPHAPQRFPMSGQSISQQMGPTPTLNQLLQSSNPVHRYQNNYEYSNQKPNETPQGAPFNHGWNARPMTPYMNQPNVAYRNQMPVSNLPIISDILV